MTSRNPWRGVKWLFVLLLLCGVAAARPGGGHSFSSGGSHSYSGGSHSYSGGSHSYSSGGGGSSNISNGQVGLILAIVIGVFVGIFVLSAVMSRRSEQESMYTSSAPILPTADPVSLAAVRNVDPDFSRIIFEDFAYELYAAAQRVRHDEDQLARLAPYISANVRAELAKRSMQVEQVVIGSMSIVRAFEGEKLDYKTTRIIVRFESNLANRSGSTFAVERWTFERAADRKTTPPPTGTRTWPCPNCGAPWSQGDDNVCAHCGTAITPGRLEWAVTAIDIEAETPVGVTLTGTTEEIGNDFPTVETGNPQADFHTLRTDDAAFAWPSFVERVGFVYARLNEAWNTQDLLPVRGLVTHSLLQYLQYWIDEYKRQKLHNRLDNARISRVVLAAVVRDPYYDAITVRVYAEGLDYTYTTAGTKLVGGSRDHDRAYTEYWTFIRSAKRRGATVAAPNCPNCGAPLAISDAGACTHCNAHVESGELDWVLSKIEQDDVYRG